MSLQFGFVILWQKAFGAKAALKMLVKLTPDGRVSDKVSGSYTIVSLSGYREIYERFSVPPTLLRYFSKLKLTYGREWTIWISGKLT
jgi:hypothetical protein